MGDGGTTNREPRSLGYHLGFLIKLEDVRWSGRSERTQSRPAARNPTRRMEKMKHPTWTSKERFKPVGGLRPPRVSLAATVWEDHPTRTLAHLRGEMDGEETGCVGTPGRWHLGDGSDFQQAIALAVLPSSSSSWPVGAHCSHPTHIKHPKAPNAAAVRNSTGPATRDGSSGLSRSRPVIEGDLSLAFPPSFQRYQPTSWHSLLLGPSSTHALLILTCPSIPNFPQ